MTRKLRKGFTLIELVVVILVLGILAAMAAPKLMDITQDARMNTTRQSLAIIRDAIELYRMETGAYPSAPTVAANMTSFIHGEFPAPEIGPNAGNQNIKAFTGTLTVGGTEGWAFDAAAGNFRVNATPYDTW